MKRILLFLGLLVLLVGQSWSYGIVSNTGATSEDSITVAVACLDSLGCPSNCDSFFVVVFKCGTNAVVFRDSGTIAMTGMDSTAMAKITYYYYHRLAADLDDGVTGQYSGFLIAKENSPLLLTPNRFDFQTTVLELDDQLTEIADVLDTLQVYDDANGFQTDVQDILDTLRVYDAAGHLLADVQAILDTLQVYDAAGHLLANVQAILDSIKLYDVTGRFSVEVNTKTGFALSNAGNAAVAGSTWNKAMSDHATDATFGGDFVDADDTPDVNVLQISGDATAANNAELFFDGTGYAGTNNVIPSVTTTTNLTTNNDKTGYALSSAGVDALWDEDTTGHNTAKSYSVMLKDTSAYQGEASALTKEAIAGTIVDSATVRPDLWTDQASGSGTELCSLLVRDSNGQAVSGMSWTVKDSAGNLLGFDATNTAGWATFNIDQHDSVHLYPTERAGLSFATYYAEPIPANGFCDTLTGTIWNYAVGAAPLCNVFINARDYFYSSTGYSDWKLRIVFGEGGNFVDTVNNVPLGGYDTEIAVTDTGLVQQQVVVSCRALKYDRSTTPPAVVDSGFYMFQLKDDRNKTVMKITKLYIPCDSTQYNLGLIIRQ